MAKLHTLVDNFQDNTLDTGTWNVTAGVTESGGRIVIVPTTTLRTIATNALTYDATLSHISVHVPVVPNNVTNQCGISVSDGTDNVTFRKSGSEMVASSLIGGVTADYTFTPYSSVNHRWWRIRLDASNVYWETSPDGFLWSIHHTTNISSLSAINFAAVGTYFYAIHTGAYPGPFEIETVNPILLQNLAGYPAAYYSSQAVTNNTTFTHTITASGPRSTTGSAAATIISPPASNYVRDLAGNPAPAYSNAGVTNNTVATFLQITASSLSQTTGVATPRRILVISATGYTGRGVTYDGDIPYDSSQSYDPHPTAGDAILSILPPGTTPNITATSTGSTTGSASLTILPESGISAGGTGLTTGSAILEIPTVFITASGVQQSTGSARVVTDHLLYASGLSITTGTATFTHLTSTYLFEPPVVFDLPPTLPDPKPRYINAHAKWKGGQRRGRTVLKNSGVYTVVDTPTVDQINAAEVAYQGGHVYTIDYNEAFDLMTAGFSVVGFQPSPPPPPTSSFPGLNVYPADTLYPAT